VVRELETYKDSKDPTAASWAAGSGNGVGVVGAALVEVGWEAGALDDMGFDAGVLAVLLCGPDVDADPDPLGCWPGFVDPDGFGVEPAAGAPEAADGAPEGADGAPEGADGPLEDTEASAGFAEPPPLAPLDRASEVVSPASPAPDPAPLDAECEPPRYLRSTSSLSSSEAEGFRAVLSSTRSWSLPRRRLRKARHKPVNVRATPAQAAER